MTGWRRAGARLLARAEILLPAAVRPRRWANGLYSPHGEQERRILRRLHVALAGRPVLGGDVSSRREPEPPLILSHFAYDRHATIKAGSDWTTAAVLNAADFNRITEVSGLGRGWRAVMRVNADIDLADETIRRVPTRVAGVEEFDFPYPIGEPYVVWLSTGW